MSCLPPVLGCSEMLLSWCQGSYRWVCVLRLSRAALESWRELLCMHISHPGEAVVRQSRSPANSQRAAGCRASSSARRTPQESICKDVLPPWPQVGHPTVSKDLHCQNYLLISYYIIHTYSTVSEVSFWCFRADSAYKLVKALFLVWRTCNRSSLKLRVLFYAVTKANEGRKQWRRPASPSGTRPSSTPTSIAGISATTCWSWQCGTNPGHLRRIASLWER